MNDLPEITCVHLRDTFGRFLNISTEFSDAEAGAPSSLPSGMQKVMEAQQQLPRALPTAPEGPRYEFRLFRALLSVELALEHLLRLRGQVVEDLVLRAPQEERPHRAHEDAARLVVELGRAALRAQALAQARSLQRPGIQELEERAELHIRRDRHHRISEQRIEPRSRVRTMASCVCEQRNRAARAARRHRCE